MSDVAAPSPEEHQLKSGWVLWEHKTDKKGAAANYGASMSQLCSFNTIEQFWKYWDNIPDPSEIFVTGKGKRPHEKSVDGFSLFKQGIEPAWEDAANRTGGEWFCRKHLDNVQLDTYWLHLVLGVIGETIDDNDEITGVRVVNKSSPKGALFRLELWFRRNDEQIIEGLKAKLVACLAGANCNGKVPDFAHRKHN